MRTALMLIAVPALAAGLAACTNSGAKTAAPVDVHWEAHNLPLDSAGTQKYLQTFTVTGDLSNVKRLCFNQFSRRMEPENASDTIIELLPGYYAIGSPRFAQTAAGDTMVINILTNGAIHSVCYGPDGVHTVLADGTTQAANFTFTPLSDNHDSYATGTVDLMPYGEEVYAFNESLAKDAEIGVYDVIPSFKNVELTGGESTVNPADATFKPIDNPAHTDEYRITVADGKMTVEAPEKNWRQIGMRLRHFFGDKARTMPDAVITDWPSLGYRGLHVDIARNYQQPAELRRVLDLMAVYGLNVLHFHPIDDEAWRVEIKALPELTEIASRRGYIPEGTSADFLPQIYRGDGNPNTKGNTANGYFTREDYIDMIKYADSLGIAVLPEIESPGHARAAIQAMKVRAERTGDNSWLLRDPSDNTDFESAQNFHDNVMNPSLEGPYKFMETVIDEFIAMHKDAGVPLPAIHIGGDEVAHGSLDGSPTVKALMEKEGLKNEHEVQGYFTNKVRKILDSKGLKFAGWQECAYKHEEDFNKEVVPSVFGINCWSTLGANKTVADDIASAGYPIILSNVEHFYNDMAYSRHPDERGLTWGGHTDEFIALAGYPARLCTVKDAKIVGVQGQTWAETITGPETLEAMILPKMAGMAERAWNPDSTYSNARFNAAVNAQLPALDAKGYNYHIRQAGIKALPGGKFTVNSSYPEAIIRYTLDGTAPTEQSPSISSGDVEDLNGSQQVKVRQWVGGHPSVVTILNVE